MPTLDVINLARELIGLDTINPPGNEERAARLIGKLLSKNSFSVEYIPFGENRLHLVARNEYGKGEKPVVFSGHFDTVPLGAANWTVHPFGGEITDGKLFGRGSSDMKGGLAAMTVAAIRSTKKNPNTPIRLIFTAAEETGCQGVAHLVENYPELDTAKGIIIGEPTANKPAIGHKGGLYLKVRAKGKTAHSSMPHLGDNAIYKAAEAVLKIKKYEFGEKVDPLLGLPTINIGKFSGGANLNSVPDHAEFTIDARTTTKSDHASIIEEFKQLVGKELAFETLVDLPAVASEENDPFVRLVYSACGISSGEKGFPKSMSYLTDGAVLQATYNNAPTIILGPGQPGMAHKTNEFCYIKRIEEAVEIYTKIILKGEKLK